MHASPRRHFGLAAGLLLLTAWTVSLCADPADPPFVPVVGTVTRFALSPPLAEVARAHPSPAAAVPAGGDDAVLERWRGDLPRQPGARAPLALEGLDPVAQLTHPEPRIVAPLLTFEGVGNLDSVLPPDCNGDVGLNHYVEMVNMHVGVFDKRTGAQLVSPFLMSHLFAAAGFGPPASNSDDGDPVVLYDHLANRWLISQFIVSVSPPHEVVAISQTADPRGRWYLYDFTMPNTKMNDYPHFGVWPDGYYMTDNQFQGFAWAGAGVFAFDRAKMLAGDPTATFQYFDLYGVDADYGGMLPADLDGPPPPAGSPNYILMVDDASVTPADTMMIWEFRVNWAEPERSSLGIAGRPNYTLPVAAFNSQFSGGRNNIPQRGTSQKLDAIADRLMHRVQYRNFGGYESLVACHTVDVDGTDHAGVRYYQLRRTLPDGAFTVHEQGTFAPDANHRWMGSAAMDGNGNLAVGYTASGTALYPSIRYAARLFFDPPGGLFQGEGELYAGRGSQTHAAARWGDYTMLGVDPSDDATFWYVSEYYGSTSSYSWRTRIGSFRLGGSTVGVLRGAVNDAATGQPIDGAKVETTTGLSALADPEGNYALVLATGRYQVVASAPFYFPVTSNDVPVLLSATTTVHFALAPKPMRVVPLEGFASAGVEGGPFAPAATDYRITNASPATLTWTTLVSVTWLTPSPAGGTLAPGAATTAVLQLTRAAEWLAATQYIGHVVFSNRTDGATEDRAVTLQVDRYIPAPIACHDFNSGLPTGWTVKTNYNLNPYSGWRFDDPGGRGNQTGGDGAFAIADSDLGGEFVPMDTELRSAPFDLRQTDAVFLEFKTDYYDFSGERADVDVSRNGVLGPWSNVWRRTGESLNGPATVFLDVSSVAARTNNVVFRFHYNNLNNWGWWWQVDDVCVYPGVKDTGLLAMAPAAALQASGYFGGPFTPDRLYRLTNTGGLPLTWNASASTNWIALEGTGGVLMPGGNPALLGAAIGPAAQALPPGAYAGELTVSNLTQAIRLRRSVLLTVLDPLGVTPANGLATTGLEGGPATPASQVYALTNHAAISCVWTARWSAAWLNASSRGGTLAPGAATNLTVSVNLAGLAPGTYADTVIISNLTARGAAQTRRVDLRVIEITGELNVFDSIAPTNDLALPFAPATRQVPRIEQLTIANSHASRSLVVSNIFFGLYQEDFNDGAAQGWAEDVDANWTLPAGRYRAASDATDFLTATYAVQTWADATIGAAFSRSGAEWSQGLVVRASDDFDTGGNGSGYLFLLSGTNYSVFWKEGPSFGALQGWTESAAIRTTTNRIAVTAVGSTLRFQINDTLVWQGTDTRFTAGRIGLTGYTTASDPAVHTFDDVYVDPPLAITVGLGGKQRHLNASPERGSRLERADHKLLGALPGLTFTDPPPVVPPSALAGALAYGAFSITNLPVLPTTLPPGARFTFDAIFAPGAAGDHKAILSIVNNDNDEPQATVQMTGRAAAGRVVGRVTAGDTGLPLVGASVVAAAGGETWATTTSTNGQYALDLLLGTYDVTAAATDFAPQTAIVPLLVDGASVTQNFALTGSSLFYTPPAFNETVRFGETFTRTVTISNTGPRTLSFSVRLRNNRFPLGAAGPLAVAPSAVPAYGVNLLNDQLVTLTTDHPETVTPLGSAGGNLTGVDFVGGDFTRLYGLDADAGQLVYFALPGGALVVVGAATPRPGHTWTGLAADPTDDALFASSSDGAQSALYRVDLNDGHATWIGDQPGLALADLALDAGGTLYGIDLAQDQLVSLDKQSGAATPIGALGYDANFEQDLDFDEAAGVLYVAAYNNAELRGELRVCDPLTGRTELVGAFPNSVQLSLAIATENAAGDWVRLGSTGASILPGKTYPLTVTFDARYVAATGTYTGHLVFDGTYVNLLPDLPLTMIVLPEDLLITPAAGFVVRGPAGGPLNPYQATYAVRNAGAGTLNWSLQPSAWVVASTPGGTLEAGQSGMVTVTVSAAGLSLGVGEYTNAIAFQNTGSTATQRREVRLQVLPPTPEAFLCFPLDQDPGWTRQGAWAFGEPQGGGSFCGDPSAGSTGTNVFGFNLAGDYGTNLLRQSLTTPAIECSLYENVHLEFQRWLGVENSAFDGAAVEVSNNGTVWNKVWAHSGNAICDGAWQSMSYDVSSIADRRLQVYVRWVMGTTDGARNYPGWNIDDICISGTPIAYSGTCGLILSEYLEGGATGNRAIEIYNGRDQAIDLFAAGYLLRVFTSPTVSTNIPLTGVVGAGATHVIVYSGSQPDLLAYANQVSSGLRFDGNDAVLLYNTNAVPPTVDSFGRFGVATNYWGVPPNTTSNHVLRRKAGITQGDTIGNDAFVPALEWDFFPSATFDGLGAHVSLCSCTLDVVSEHGGAQPAPGRYYFRCGTTITCSLTNAVVAAGESQYVCNGWRGTGKLAAPGTGLTTGPFNLSIGSTILWQWRTNHWLDINVSGFGTVDVADGWQAHGATVVITATPDPDYSFGYWAGDTNGCVSDGMTLSVPVTGPRHVTAVFDSPRAPLGTPTWWLELHGLTNDGYADEEVKDADGDGALAWEEFTADTVPTNPGSVLRLTGVAPVAGGLRVNWKGGVQARQYLEWRQNLRDSTDVWRVLYTNQPPTASSTNITDPAGTNRARYYRIQVESAP